MNIKSYEEGLRRQASGFSLKQNCCSFFSFSNDKIYNCFFFFNTNIINFKVETKYHFVENNEFDFKDIINFKV